MTTVTFEAMIETLEDGSRNDTVICCLVREKGADDFQFNVDYDIDGIVEIYSEWEFPLDEIFDARAAFENAFSEAIVALCFNKDSLIDQYFDFTVDLH